MSRGNAGWVAGSVAAVLLGAAMTSYVEGRGRLKPVDLVVEDSELVAWMPINNTFNVEPGSTHWDGVLIQIGDYLDVDDEGRPFNLFRSVTFEDKRGEEVMKLNAGQFTWIDIVATDALRGEPMGTEHLPLLFPAAGTDSGCSAFDACAIQECSCASPPCAPTGYEPLGRCLRARSLHGNFTPLAVVTYWQGPAGYDVATRPTHLGSVSTHTFTFHDPVEVFVDGQPLTLDSIRSIHVNGPDDPTHGSSTDPPWYP